VAITPIDILKTQNAIDRYEKAFRHGPSPSAAEALAWQARRGKFQRIKLAIRKLGTLIHDRRRRTVQLDLST
jgi:hypothetical protein